MLASGLSTAEKFFKEFEKSCENPASRRVNHSKRTFEADGYLLFGDSGPIEGVLVPRGAKEQKAGNLFSGGVLFLSAMMPTYAIYPGVLPASVFGISLHKAENKGEASS